MKTKYFKKFALRVDTVAAKAKFVILIIPTVVIAWLNWSAAVLWKEHFRYL